MKLSRLWTGKSSPKENSPSPSSQVSETNRPPTRSKLSKRRDYATTDTKVFGSTKVLTKNPSREPNQKERILPHQIGLPLPMGTPPLRPPSHRPSQDNDLLSTPPGSTHSVPHSQASNVLPKCDSVSFGAFRAGTLGETVTTECRLPSSDVEANVVEVAAPVPLQHSPPVASSGHIANPERARRRELSVAYTPETFDALFQQPNEGVTAILSTAGIAQSRRRRLRAATARARRMAEDLANPEFSVANLAVLIPAGPANDHATSVNNVGETSPSASNGAESSSAVAPVAVNPLLHENSGESMIPTAASETQATAESSESPQISSLESETLDPEFFLAKPNALGLSDPVDNNDAVVYCEGDTSLSAKDETKTSSAVAPATHIHETSGPPTIQATLSDEQTAAEPSESNYLLQSETVDPDRSCSRCRGTWASSTSSISPFEYEHFLAPSPTEEVGISPTENGQLDLNPEEDEGIASEKRSYDSVPQYSSITKANNDSLTGSGAIIQRERTSAEDEARPSTSVAPTQPAAVLCPQPVRPVIQITPPSPTNTIQPSQSNLLALSTAMNRYNSARPPNHRRVPYSPASSDGPGLVRQADRLAVPSFQRSRSRRFQTAGSSQPEDAVAGVNRRSLDRPVGLVEDTAEGHITPVGIHGLSKSGSPCPSAETLPKFGYSGDSVSQGSAPLTHRIHGTPSGSSKRDGRAIGPGVKLSAAGGAEPSSSVAPSRSPALLRKPRKVKAVSKSCVPHPAHRQSGSLVSRISSSLREWGNTASRLFTFRPSAKVEENGSFSPYIDPWERFVPSRGPSPETAPDDDPASSESKIWNIYVKLDEAM